MLCSVATRLKSTKVHPFQFSSPMSATFLRFNFGRFQLSVAFLFSVCRQNCVFPLKFKKKKKRKNFPLSVFRKVIHICLSCVFRCQILSLICVGTLASSLLSFLLNLLVDVGCVFSTELYTLTFRRLASVANFGTDYFPLR